MLKLNNHTSKKNIYKINFLWKTMRPKSVVLQSRKKPKKLQVLEKKFFEKKILLAYLCRYDLQNNVQNFFLNKWVSGYLSFGDLSFKKIVPHSKIINKS